MGKRIDLKTIKGSCSACGACLTVCPKKAISMDHDEYGFQYPHIEDKLCVECGKCLGVCPCLNISTKNKVSKVYAAISLDQDVKKKSASGGVFGTLAVSFINQGYVSGAIFDSQKDIRQTCHIVTDREGDVRRIQGSKYVQSSSWKCFSEIISLLNSGKKVLFSGTPCQVDALKRITGNPDNLFTIDLICHGVPSMKMLNEYLDMMSGCFLGRIDNIVFRSSESKTPFCAKVTKSNGKSYFVEAELLSYYKYFLSGKIYRSNCYSCQYACKERVGDLSIGDYWGIENYHGDIVSKGDRWSCVLVNSDKGEYLLEQFGGSLRLVPSNYEWVTAHNGQLNKPSDKPGDREMLMEEYRKHGYRGIEKIYRKTRNGNIRYLRQLWTEMFKS